MHSNCNLQSIKRALLFSIISIILVSCGFQGRKYTTGHYWNQQVSVNPENFPQKSLPLEEDINKVSSKIANPILDTLVNTFSLPQFKNKEEVPMNHPTTNDIMKPIQIQIRNEIVPIIIPADSIPDKVKSAKNAVSFFSTMTLISSLFHVFFGLNKIFNSFFPLISEFWFLIFLFLLASLFFNLISNLVLKKRLQHYQQDSNDSDWYKNATRILARGNIILKSGTLILLVYCFILLIVIFLFILWFI